mmetsp:Transcript_232/g.1104  ORF Transcript_232/g.1104 Transcript_232/m.1104 type:complete len:218 (-) Transcript_232:2065-2718(-)
MITSSPFTTRRKRRMARISWTTSSRITASCPTWTGTRTTDWTPSPTTTTKRLSSRRGCARRLRSTIATTRNAAGESTRRPAASAPAPWRWTRRTTCGTGSSAGDARRTATKMTKRRKSSRWTSKTTTDRCANGSTATGPSSRSSASSPGSSASTPRRTSRVTWCTGNAFGTCASTTGNRWKFRTSISRGWSRLSRSGSPTRPPRCSRCFTRRPRRRR